MDFYLFPVFVAFTVITFLGAICYKYMVSSPSVKPSLPHTWKYDVFPSFHGPDVRNAFLAHVLKEFRIKGIYSFIDDDIKRGKSIGPELLEAIRGSKIAIVLLSKNYASSTWCLNELVEIMRCREEVDQIVMTIFYGVDPTDVKKQIGDFGKVFDKTCMGKTKGETKKWRQVLSEVAQIAGYHISNRETETTLIEKIATDISNKLNVSTPSRDFNDLVGMRTHMEKIEPSLRLDLNEVRMIGIWGPPGIGKTTIARFLFDQHSKKFELSVFMENVKGKYTLPTCSDDYRAKLQLQEQFLSQITNHMGMEVRHLGVLQERLKNKKILAILDNVDRLAQLEALAKEAQWFGRGSRIIITTQDLRILKAHGISHIYKVDFPSFDEALQIFCMYAFGKKKPEVGFVKLARKVTALSGELPLGLKVMGSYFRGMRKEEWIQALPRLKRRLNGEIESILRFSYDALFQEDKYLFLHIACFFNFEKVKKVEAYLAKSFSDVRQGLKVLAEKSLISIGDGRVTMHSLLVQLGIEIIRNQSLNDPGQQQFLVEDEDICEVLTGSTPDSRNIIGIKFKYTGNELSISEKAFERMPGLQFLRFEGYYENPDNSSSLGRLENISPKLRLLDWDHCPLTCFPSNVNTKFFVELHMVQSKLERLWKGNQPLQNLKWMDLSDSKNLIELPDFSTATSLTKLYLKGCSSLVKLPSSIGNATNLKILNLRKCTSLVELPSSIGNATSFRKLDFNKCSSLRNLPSIGTVNNLEEFDIRGCSSLVEFPSSNGNAINLKEIDMSRCSSLVELSSFIGNATYVEKMNMSGCSSLVKLHSSIGNINLRIINLSGCSSLAKLPFSIGNATNLEELNLSRCSSLVELPMSIGNATRLEKLNLSECSSLMNLPSSIGNATNLRDIDLSGCSSLTGLPSSIQNVRCLDVLNLSRCLSLVELPDSIGNSTENYFTGDESNVNAFNFRGCLRMVQNLDLSECSSLVKLPSSIWNATNLKTLDLSGCLNLMELPSSVGKVNLQYLNLSRCSKLVELPSCIGNATGLKKLYLSSCLNLVELPFNIGNATNLRVLDLSSCSSLVTLPSSIGNLQKLRVLMLEGCSKLEVLPSNINLKSLRKLDLTSCSLLKSFPKISTNIQDLYLIGTSIQEVSSPWSKLTRLYMSYTESLKEFPYTLRFITDLHLSDTEIQELGIWVKDCCHLKRLVVNGCKNLLSLPQLPKSLSEIDAEDCESLETLDCCFLNQNISLNFTNCVKLNKEARELIIKTSTGNEFTILPGREIPTFFTYQACGDSLVMKLNKRLFPSSVIFKACILLATKNDVVMVDEEFVYAEWCIMDKRNNIAVTCTPEDSRVHRILEEHMYIFEFKADVTSDELLFKPRMRFGKCAIVKCGIMEISGEDQRI